MSQRRASARSLPQEPRTRTVMKDEEGGIAFLEETNQELIDEYKRLLSEYQQLRESYELVESKYQDTQKENVKVKRNLELTTEKFHREKGSLVKQKEDINVQNEKLRKELREKSAKVCPFLQAINRSSILSSSGMFLCVIQ